MKADYHLHCEFSDDSVELMETQVEQAIKIGLEEMCFTDHVDYGIKRDWDDPKGVIWEDVTENGETLHKALANVDYPKYFDKLFDLADRYQNRITIKAGLEFGIQSHTVEDYRRLYDIDWILFCFPCIRWRIRNSGPGIFKGVLLRRSITRDITKKSLIQ